LTEFAKRLFVRAGFDESRITVKPNFISDPLDGRAPALEGRNGALFVGRLSEEKGVDVLIRAWDRLDIPLKIVGPASESYARRTNNPVIEFLGEVDYNRVSELMQTSAFLVFPSILYEGLGMVMLEAFAHGLPVIGSKLGSIPEVVEDGVNGRLFEPGSDLKLAATVAALSSDEIAVLSAGARQTFLDRYTPDANYEMLSTIYRDALACPLAPDAKAGYPASTTGKP
ncbi:MAG: glycosyltransferase, partial [Gammaproteobacteria bacterium]|nr:glycosyltransferase [Gammaproteobacteria bacterium]NNL52050.1 glycosyltransferase [Woeseiaceae bacterium]